MKSHWQYAISFVLLVIIGCGSPDHIWNEDSNRVAREVRKTLINYCDDVSREGFMAEFEYLDSSSLFSWHPPGFASAISFDSVKTILLRNANIYTKVECSWDSLVIIPESNVKAKYTGRMKTILTDTAGIRNTYYFAEVGHVMKKEDGWKLVSGKTERIGL